MNILKKIFFKIYYFIKKLRYYRNPFKKYGIIFYDTIFPCPFSGFRLEEFTKYLSCYEDSTIVVNPLHYLVLNQTVEDFENDIKNFGLQHPELVSKIQANRPFSNINGTFFYCVFYCNILGMFPYIKKYKIPFAFTLYPGGGFNIESSKVQENLKMICSSPYFKGVIVTQKITKDYLISKKICTKEQIHYIFGGIVPQNSIGVKRDVFFKSNKTTLDICFCANKYMPKGLDKGYDIFIEVASRLIKKYEFVEFHVIGGFTEDDIKLGEIKDKVRFYGKVKFEELQKIFIGMDIILSPNRPHTLSKGAFDGFPLGTVIEAALNGVIPIVTDELNQNDGFTENEIYIAKPSVGSFMNIIEQLINNVDFRSQSERTVKKFNSIYNNQIQLLQRIKTINGMQ